ncbi:MAG: hypothetical protein U5K54_17705 [Cytophagales bacterium]|nr:hypothetical protein [Cytophagales bacterium]
MRIAIVVNRFPTLSETFIFNKVKGLVQQGLDVTVIRHSPVNDSYAYKEDWKTISKQIKIVEAFGKRDVFSFRLYIRILTNLKDSIAFLRTMRKGKRESMNSCVRIYDGFV